MTFEERCAVIATLDGPPVTLVRESLHNLYKLQNGATIEVLRYSSNVIIALPDGQAALQPIEAFLE